MLNPATLNVLSLGCLRLRLLPRRPGVVVLVTDVGHIHPGVSHFINCAITIPHPLVRIGIVRVGPGIVIPRGHADNRAFRQHRDRIVGVGIVKLSR